MLELLYILLSTLTGIDRSVDAGLAASAQVRAETVICASGDFWTHNGKPDGVAEILVCFGDPAATPQQAANAWRNSAPHWGVLTGSYSAIGCGVSSANGGVMFACHLARGDVPNTATPYDAGLLTAAGVLLVVLASAVRQRSGRASPEHRGRPLH